MSGRSGIRIWLVEPSGRGGVCQYAHNLGNALADRGHAVTVATGLDFETKPFPRTYRALEVWDRFRPRPGRLAGFFRAIRADRPDVVHIQGAVHPGSCFLIWQVLRRVVKSRFVYTAQDIFPKHMRSYHPWVLKRIYRGMPAVTVNAQQNKEEIVGKFGVAPERVVVVPLGDLAAFLHGVETAPPAEAPPGRPVILFFGVVEPRKGVATLIRAFAGVRERVPDAFLLIAGKAYEDTRRYAAEVARLGLKGHVGMKFEYLPLRGLPGLLRAADVVAVPYEQGWNSGVIATAYGFGKPVVATDIGGLREVVRDGRTGILVPPGNPDALAAALIRVLQDSALRERMGREARLAAEQNAWSGIAGRVERIYRTVLGTASGEAEPERP